MGRSNPVTSFRVYVSFCFENVCFVCVLKVSLTERTFRVKLPVIGDVVSSGRGRGDVDEKTRFDVPTTPPFVSNLRNSGVSTLPGSRKSGPRTPPLSRWSVSVLFD